MHSLPILALAAAKHVTTMDALPHLVGMLMVLVTLAILWGVCAFTAKSIALFSPKSVAAPAAKPSPTAPQPVAAGIDPETLAAIAAAVTVVTGASHRIVSIKSQSTTWEKAGRQSVLTSHRIR